MALSRVVQQLRRSPFFQRGNMGAARLLLVLLVIAVCSPLFPDVVPIARFTAAAAPAEKGRGASTKASPSRDNPSTLRSDGLGAAANPVITITMQNFQQTIKEGTWFVKFYADWCTHCQRLQPTWKELATELKGKVNVGQVNCDTEKELCRRFHVRGYPTLVHIHNRRSRVYKNSRSKDALKAFATTGYKKAPAISALKSPFGPLENLKAFVLRLILRFKDLAVEQVEMGTPMWVVCLTAVAMLVVVTVIVAVFIVTSSRPKQD